MRPLIFASAACDRAIASLVGPGGMAVCKAVILSTPPGIGEMTDVDHLGWGLRIPVHGSAFDLAAATQGLYHPIARGICQDAGPTAPLVETPAVDPTQLGDWN